jgi:hypothetical protein
MQWLDPHMCGSSYGEARSNPPEIINFAGIASLPGPTAVTARHVSGSHLEFAK